MMPRTIHINFASGYDLKPGRKWGLCIVLM